MAAQRSSKAKPLVGVVMGSDSDWDTMKNACEMLAKFGIPYEARVVSAHRTPDLMFEYAASARKRGLRAIIAGAGGAAHLPGMLASKTHAAGARRAGRIQAAIEWDQDSLLSIVQMPKGVPVATFAIGVAGAANAGLYAVSILASGDARLAAKLDAFRKAEARRVAKMQLPGQP